MICAICLDEAAFGMTTACCHQRFHTGCMLRWMCRRMFSCPQCRGTVVSPLCIGAVSVGLRLYELMLKVCILGVVVVWYYLYLIAADARKEGDRILDVLIWLAAIMVSSVFILAKFDTIENVPEIPHCVELASKLGLGWIAVYFLVLHGPL